MTVSEVLFSFKGRIGRLTYWAYMLAFIVFSFVAQTIDYSIGYTEASDIGPFDIAATLLMLWPVLAVSVKRWHDRNKSALWVLIGLIPIIGIIWVLIENGCLRGTDGSNRFGRIH